MSFSGSQVYQTATFSGMKMLTSSICLGFKRSKILFSVSLQVERGPCSKPSLLHLGCSSLASTSLPFPD